MTKLIVLIVIVLGVVAIAQLVRLYELSSKIRNRREEDIPNRENKLNANLLLVFMLAFFAGVIYLMVEYGWTGRGPAASSAGVESDWLLNLNFIIVFAVFFLTNGLLFGFAWKYVRKPGVKAFYFPHDNKLELIWTIIPAIVLAVIIVLGLKSWNDQTGDSSTEATRVELFSKQFDWTVRIAGDDNELAYYDYKLTNENNPLALMTKATIQNAIDSMENGGQGVLALERLLNNPKIMQIPEDRAKTILNLGRKERLLRMLYQMKSRHNSKLDKLAMDDITFGANDTLYLCKNKEYEFSFRAKDVIHSAYFPHFRAQMNTVPGLPTRLKFTPILSTTQMREQMNDEKFNYVLMCNKICGSSHYKMKLMVVVLEPKAYAKWYKSVKVAKSFKELYAVGKPVMKEVTPASDSTATAPMVSAMTIAK